MSNKEPLVSQPQELKIVLIGKVGAGKTAVLNTLLSFSEKNEKPTSESHIPLPTDTEECQKTKVKIGKRSVVVVDTPGLPLGDRTEKVAKDIKKSVLLTSLGRFVFVFVMRPDRFKQDEVNMVEIFWKTFGEMAAQCTLVLFTCGDKFKKDNQTIKEFIEESEKLKNFVSKCNGEPFLIDNKNPDLSEVTKLLEQINDMVDKSEGKGYTCREAEKQVKLARMKKKIALSVNGSALAGAGVGAAATYFTGSVGVPIGLTAGAAVGGVVGFVGIVAAEHIKAKKCVIQ